MKAMILGVCLAAFFAAETACAGDTQPHHLTITLPDSAVWQEEIVTDMPDTLIMAGGKVAKSYRNVLQSNGTGFDVSRTLSSSRDDRKPAPDMADMSDILSKMSSFADRIDYAAGTSLTPTAVTNLSAILRRIEADTSEMFGKDMADQMGTEIPPLTSEELVAQHLSLETLMGHLRQAPLVIGVPQTAPDTVWAIDDTATAAHITVTLARWDETTDQAEYTLTTEADPEAKAAVLNHFFLNFLYPLNTMDDAQVAAWHKNAADQARLAVYTEQMTCRFTASIRTGLVTAGNCDRATDLQSPLVSQGSLTHTEISQKLLP